MKILTYYGSGVVVCPITKRSIGTQVSRFNTWCENVTKEFTSIFRKPERPIMKCYKIKIELHFSDYKARDIMDRAQSVINLLIAQNIIYDSRFTCTGKFEVCAKVDKKADPGFICEIWADEKAQVNDEVPWSQYNITDTNSVTTTDYRYAGYLKHNKKVQQKALERRGDIKAWLRK
jgi:hypothetical protein